MNKSLKIINLKDTNTDFMYWMSRSETERLQAIETLRLQYINYKKDVQSRLQRVYRIVNQKQG
jgi:chlorite dismutase